MKDKEIIEEMAKVICRYVKGKLPPSDIRLIKNENSILLKHSHNYGIAKELYNADYRKIDKDSVVLSKEEWREYVDNENKAYYRGQHETEVYYKNIQIPRERKETAERDFNAIIKALETKKASIMTHYGIKESVGADVAIRTVKELAKQFDIEIKEKT